MARKGGATTPGQKGRAGEEGGNDMRRTFAFRGEKEGNEETSSGTPEGGEVSAVFPQNINLTKGVE